MKNPDKIDQITKRVPENRRSTHTSSEFATKRFVTEYRVRTVREIRIIKPNQTAVLMLK
tara:strand:- start:42 stop:218 length:177 start_codon:yes stop_codon:yes gene_type:complete